MKRDVPSVYFGIIVGLSLGFVLCNVVHAEPTGGGTGRFEPVPELGEATGGDIWGSGYNDNMLLYGLGPYRPNTLGPYEGDLLEKQANCYTQMEAAMRAMDEFVYREPPLTTTTEADLCVYSAVCRAARELDRVRRRTDAAKQWEQAKACWRKP